MRSGRQAGGQEASDDNDGATSCPGRRLEQGDEHRRAQQVASVGVRAWSRAGDAQPVTGRGGVGRGLQVRVVLLRAGQSSGTSETTEDRCRPRTESELRSAVCLVASRTSTSTPTSTSSAVLALLPAGAEFGTAHARQGSPYHHVGRLSQPNPIPLSHRPGHERARTV